MYVVEELRRRGLQDILQMSHILQKSCAAQKPDSMQRSNVMQRPDALERPDMLQVPDGQAGTVSAWENCRSSLMQLILQEEYGFLPPEPVALYAEKLETVNENFCAGKAPLRRVRLTAQLEGGSFSFPVQYVIPKNGSGMYPAFILIQFRSDVPDRSYPAEEIADQGFAVFVLDYQDIARDQKEGYLSGLGQLLFPDGKRAESSCGTIGMWAWGAMRVCDFACQLSEIDRRHIAVIGHSRLGKTALLAGACDSRFRYVISNDSGCSGAAISRQKSGETIADICQRFDYWFCERYTSYAEREAALPFDQHALIAACAPRSVLVGSAALDSWADPESEYLGLCAASPVWSLYGKKGLIHPDRPARANDVFYDGDIGYHQRPGTHYLSRQDWHYYMDFIQRQIQAEGHSL